MIDPQPDSQQMLTQDPGQSAPYVGGCQQLRAALAALIAECECVNKRSLDQLGMGVIDLVALRKARGVLEATR